MDKNGGSRIAIVIEGDLAPSTSSNVPPEASYFFLIIQYVKEYLDNCGERRSADFCTLYARVARVCATQRVLQ